MKVDGSWALQEGTRVLIVRPYPTRMRTRVFTLLHSAMLDMNSGRQIPAGTSDADAIEGIMETKPDVLLVPFHAHRDAQGQRLDGLTLCGKLYGILGASPIPVLMPVTPMAGASLRLMTHTGKHADLYRDLLERHILLVPDGEVDEHETIPRVVAHLRRHGVRLGATPV